MKGMKPIIKQIKMGMVVTGLLVALWYVTAMADSQMPEVISPLDNAMVATMTPQLIVTNVADGFFTDPRTYFFELFNINPVEFPDAGSIAQSGATDEGGSGQTIWPLPENNVRLQHTYWWWVRVWDGNQYGPWTAPVQFLVINGDGENPPGAPTLNQPANIPESACQAAMDRIELSVNNAVDPDPADSLVYEFRVAADRSFSQIVAGAQQIAETEDITTWALTGASAWLDENTFYYWQARAYDGTFYGPCMAAAYFFVNSANDPPPAPVPVLPQDGGTLATTTPQLIVSNAMDPDVFDPALVYFFELFDSDPGATPNIEPVAQSGPIGETSGGQTLWPVSDNLLQIGRTYWWRVRAWDGAYYSPWTKPADFSMGNASAGGPPGAPSLNYPSNTPLSACQVVQDVVELSVNNALDSDALNTFDTLTYAFRVAKDAAFTQVIAEINGVAETSNTTAWIVSNLVAPFQENTFYYWQCRVWDGTYYGPWMPTARFYVNTVNEPATAPGLIAPENGATVSTLTPDLVVAGAHDPDYFDSVLSYIFEVYDVDPQSATNAVPILVSDPMAVQTDGQTTWAVSDQTLQEDLTYWWRSRGCGCNPALDTGCDCDIHNSGEWSSIAQFQINTANQPPQGLTIADPTPADGAEVEANTVTLAVINAFNPEGAVLTYRFTIDPTASLSSAAARSITLAEDASGFTEWTVSGLSEDTMYYWQVVVIEDGVATEARVGGTFFTSAVNNPPPLLQLLYPLNNARTTNRRPTLEVLAIDEDADHDSVSYAYELYVQGAVAVPLMTYTSVESTWELTAELAINTTYAWRARGLDAHGLAGEWSAFYIFTVGPNVHQPYPPTLNNPYSGGWVAVLQPVLSLMLSTDLDGDTLEYFIELFADRDLQTTVEKKQATIADSLAAAQIETLLEEGHTYYWRAKAYDGKYYSTWMPTASFTVNISGTGSFQVTPDLSKVAYARSTGDQVFSTAPSDSNTRVELTIPKGALEEDLNIMIGRVSATAPALPEKYIALCDVIFLGPSDYVFKLPVTLRLSMAAPTASLTHLAGADNLQLMTYRTGTNGWQPVAMTLNEEGAVAVAQIDHFSLFTLVESNGRIDGAGDDADDSGSGGGCFIQQLQ